MPIQTNLSVSPYFDDYTDEKDFYKILFKPGVSVQTRELNQLQTILQTQIERFGDNILKKGTIIDGCNFTFIDAQPYVKIVDNETDGTTAVPSLYVGKLVRNSANLEAFITNYVDGFESTDPDLKTLYVNFRNSGNTFNLTQYTPGELLTIFDSNNSIYKVNVIDGGVGFSNNDTVIFTPQVAVELTSGTLSAGEFLIDTTAGALGNLEIISVDTNALAGLGYVLLGVKPRIEDLTSSTSNSSYWTIPLNAEIQNSTGSVSGYLRIIYGTNAQARVRTINTGEITSLSLLNRGVDYDYAPHVSVKSLNNTTGLSTLELTAQNYVAKIKVYSASDAVGNGYIFSVDEGIIYQQGFFQRVENQSVIVTKYNTQPNNLVAGFQTFEDIINSNEDTSLLDNALGSENETAPGADRLKLTPQLIVMNREVALANNEFFPVVEWNEGSPYKQNQITVYNRVGDEIARNTFDSSGNFVIDSFQVTTTSPSNSNNEGSVYSVVVDPGQAYISGYKVQTLDNYKIDIKKGLDTSTSSTSLSLNYGNYIRIREVGGTFLFNVGATVDFYSLPKGFLSNTTLINTNNTSPLGTKIGTAKMRSLVLESDTPGTANSIYRLYLFDIQPDINFGDIKSVYYDGTTKGIGDVVLELDASTGRQVASLKGIKEDGLLFPTGVESLKNSNNTSYIYRTVDRNTSITDTGTLTKSIAGNENEFFARSGSLSSGELRSLYVVPTGNDCIQFTALDGTINVTTTSNVVTGTSTNFISDFVEGDYVQIYSTVVDNVIKRVTRVISATAIQIDSAPSFANTTSIFKRVFPKNVPIPFGYRSGLTANVDVNKKILTLNFAHSNSTQLDFIAPSPITTSIAFNVNRENVTSSTKTANRNKFVKLRLSDNAGGVTGPWALGVPDIFRLRKVYTATSSSVNTASFDITNKFYIDHNQTTNFLGMSYLFLRPRSGLNLTTSDFLLVEFDYFTNDSTGYFDAKSYRRTSDAETIAALDSLDVDTLSSSAHSLEIQEVVTFDGQVYDLINQFDFRPSIAPTASPADNASSAPINPANTETFNQTDDKKFPVPDSVCRTNIEYYLGRIDDVYIGERSNIFVLQGIPDEVQRNRQPSNTPKNALKLQTISVPAYPNIPRVITNQLSEVLNLGIANERYTSNKFKTKVVTPLLNASTQQKTQPMVYSMEDIGNLERRIKDLEYYVSLSILETSITNRVIPSSIDPTINRFKFGFFADDFSSETYSDVTNPQYAVSIEVEGDDSSSGAFINPLIDTNGADKTNGTTTIGTFNSAIPLKSTNRIVPPKINWGLRHYTDNIPYIDQMVLSQNLATDRPAICLPNLQIQNVTNMVGEGYYTSLRENYSNPRAELKIDTITMGSVANTAVLYFYAYQDHIAIKVYQGNTLIADTSNNFNALSNLTNDDKNFLATNPSALGWYNAIRPTNLNLNYVRIEDDTGFLRWAGKLTFNHTPTAGRTYTITTDNRTHTDGWKWLLKYPSSSTAQFLVDVNNCGGLPMPLFNGTMKVFRNVYWSCSANFRINHTNYTAFILECTGLKPNTLHTFRLDGEVYTDYVQDFGAFNRGGTVILEAGTAELAKLERQGAPRSILSDAGGKARIVVYVPIRFNNWIVNELMIVGGGGNGIVQPTVGSSGYSALEVSDTGGGSGAKIVIPNRLPNKVLPQDPRGNV